MQYYFLCACHFLKRGLSYLKTEMYKLKNKILCPICSKAYICASEIDSSPIDKLVFINNDPGL